MAGKWFLRDGSAPQRVLVGTLTDVHRSSGLLSDDDTNLLISPVSSPPDDPYLKLLVNRHGHSNSDPQLECEINVGSDWRDRYEDWVRGLVGGEVTAQGVWVDDDDHEGKTELHPMDIIFGSITGSNLSDWIGALAHQRGLTVGESMLAFRFAVASDDRAGVFQDGPPLAQWTRPITFTLPYPARPTQGVWAPAIDQRLDLQEHATIETAVRDDVSRTLLDVIVTCLGRDYGGPGVLTGELVTYWSSPMVPQIVVDPVELSFGLVTVGLSVPRTVRIENAGQVDIVVTLVGSHSLNDPFLWPDLATTVTPGDSLNFTVEFEPHGNGAVQRTLFIRSNTAGSPHAVTLRGTGRKLPGGDP